MLVKVFNKYIILVILLCLVFFILPNITFACAKRTTKVEQKSCLKFQSINSSTEDCTQSDSCCTDKEHKRCVSKCKHNSCKCRTAVSYLHIVICDTFSPKNIFVETKKQKFAFKQAYYSSGLFSIWQPPKIS